MAAGLGRGSAGHTSGPLASTCLRRREWTNPARRRPHPASAWAAGPSDPQTPAVTVYVVHHPMKGDPAAQPRRPQRVSPVSDFTQAPSVHYPAADAGPFGMPRHRRSAGRRRPHPPFRELDVRGSPTTCPCECEEGSQRQPPLAAQPSAVLAGGLPAEPLEAPLLFLPLHHGAVVMVCDETCLVAVANRVPTIEPLMLSETNVCCTCHACSFTAEGARCPCKALQVSCSSQSWLLTTQAADALDVIQDACGPTVLTAEDWRQLLHWADQMWLGGLVGLRWVRDRQPESDR